jgi:hypothetical protein
MHDDEQHVLALGAPEQRDPQQRLRGEIERARRGGVEPLLQRRVVDPGPDVHDRERDRLRRGDGRARQAVGTGEPGAQRLVALHDRVEAAPQPLHVERAGQAHRRGHVVGRGRRLELREEPQPLLRERQRRWLPRWTRAERR